MTQSFQLLVPWRLARTQVNSASGTLGIQCFKMSRARESMTESQRWYWYSDDLCYARTGIIYPCYTWYTSRAFLTVLSRLWRSFPDCVAFLAAWSMQTLQGGSWVRKVRRPGCPLHSTGIIYRHDMICYSYCCGVVVHVNSGVCSVRYLPKYTGVIAR